MSITSNRTEETVFSSGIKATGRASATVTTASRPETRITPLSTSIDCGSGVYLWGGLGAGAAPGGGSESLRDTEQKTVGPSRVKIREIARGGYSMNYFQIILTALQNRFMSQETMIYRVFSYVVAEKRF